MGNRSAKVFVDYSLERLKQIARKYDLILLPEIHAEYGSGLHEEVAGEGFPVYDFFFPGLAARGESPLAFDEREILAACVAPPSNTGGILSRRALPARRLARLGATPDFHHGLLVIDALDRGTNAALIRWIRELIDQDIQTINMLGCHDGIPVLDLKDKEVAGVSRSGLLTAEHIDAIIERVMDRGGEGEEPVWPRRHQNLVLSGECDVF